MSSYTGERDYLRPDDPEINAGLDRMSAEIGQNILSAMLGPLSEEKASELINNTVKDGLKKSLNMALDKMIEHLLSKSDSVFAENKSLRARIKELEAALEPFAKVAIDEMKSVEEGYRATYELTDYVSVFSHGIKWGTFLVARETLARGRA